MTFSRPRLQRRGLLCEQGTPYHQCTISFSLTLMRADRSAAQTLIKVLAPARLLILRAARTFLPAVASPGAGSLAELGMLLWRRTDAPGGGCGPGGGVTSSGETSASRPSRRRPDAPLNDTYPVPAIAAVLEMRCCAPPPRKAGLTVIGLCWNPCWPSNGQVLMRFLPILHSISQKFYRNRPKRRNFCMKINFQF